MALRSFLLALPVTLAATSLLGCQDDPATPRPDPIAQPARSTAEPAARPIAHPSRVTVVLMRAHFDKATAARRAIIAGDIETARTNIRWLADHDPSVGELPPELRPRLDDMRSRARAFATASTFTEAGAAFGSLLTRCGGCHVAASRGPQFADSSPPEGNELADRMQRHAWAAERLWQGLVTRDAARYDSGARSLANVVVRATELPQGISSPERVQAVADNVRGLAAQGLAATDWDARAQAYGGFLATCATCHRLMGTGAIVGAVLAQQQAREQQADAPPAP